MKATAVRTPRALPGGYQLVRLVGRGAFARVFEATAPGGDRVAVKILTSSHPQALKRFQREVKVIRALEANPNVVQYLDHGTTDDGVPFLVMELVSGFTLGQLLATGRRFSQQAACALMIQLCKSFQDLHSLGVTHRDVKPANVMLSKPPKTPGLGASRAHQDVIHLAQVERSAVRIKLLDFGLVSDSQGLLNLLERHELLAGRDFSEELDVGMLAGTPEYIAPEQLTDAWQKAGTPARTDTATDVFALGVVFYQILTGAVPWPFDPGDSHDSDDATALQDYLAMRAVGQDAPPPAGIGRPLWSIIERALSTNPKLRQRDAAALAQDLERYVEFGEGIAQRTDIQATMLAHLEPDPDTRVPLDVVLARAEVPTPVPRVSSTSLRVRVPALARKLNPGLAWREAGLAALVVLFTTVLVFV